ncbi:MAG: hypothetical protein ACI9MF_001847, partial [Gammaproteobacteria bacterium]
RVPCLWLFVVIKTGQAQQMRIKGRLFYLTLFFQIIG